jgi:hypothetical protein
MQTYGISAEDEAALPLDDAVQEDHRHRALEHGEREQAKKVVVPSSSSPTPSRFEEQAPDDRARLPGTSHSK